MDVPVLGAGSSRAPWVVEPLDNNVLIFQMGGDFLLDEAGTVLFSHRCGTPLDRPSVQDVLQAADVRV